jgi:protein gp37
MYREKTYYGQDPSTVIRSKPTTFNLPRRLPPGELVFVCSWSDFFHEAADPWRVEAWEIIRRRPDLTFIIPTKRLQRVQANTPWLTRIVGGPHVTIEDPINHPGPWQNVWLLYSASTDQELTAGARALHELTYIVRGVSLGPLLGPILFRLWRCPCGWSGPQEDLHGGTAIVNRLCPMCGNCGGLLFDNLLRLLDWVIVEGESGGPPDRALVQKRHPVWGWSPKPEATAWLRQIRDQCRDHGVPFHFKGWGGPRPDSGGRLLDGREWLEFPRSGAWLRVAR